MTANVADDDDDDGQTVTSIDTTGTVDTAAVAGLTRADLAETGDGGDSDEEGDGFHLQNDMQENANETAIDKRTSDYREIEETVLDSEENGVECLAGGGDPSNLLGAPAGWNPPVPPEDWTRTRRPDWGEPEVPDNPGGRLAPVLFCSEVFRGRPEQKIREAFHARRCHPRAGQRRDGQTHGGGLGDALQGLEANIY